MMEELYYQNKQKEENDDLDYYEDKPPESSNMGLETQLLEQTLYKIGSLMAIGYGEAGSKIIG